MSSKLAKFRIVPGNQVNTYRVEVRGLWTWQSAWDKYDEIEIYYSSIEDADRGIQSVIRNELWTYAVPVVEYDERGVRL
jgi:hypothetical protein